MSHAWRFLDAGSRSVKNVSANAGAEFRRVLADVGEAAVGDGEETARLINPAAGAAFPTPESEPSSGVRWSDISGWFVEGDEQPSPSPDYPLTDRWEDIAAELDLDRALNEVAVNRARRLFMWRNHPDRQDESRRALATRRVAIANMLADLALSRLAGDKKKKPV